MRLLPRLSMNEGFRSVSPHNNVWPLSCDIRVTSAFLLHSDGTLRQVETAADRYLWGEWSGSRLGGHKRDQPFSIEERKEAGVADIEPDLFGPAWQREKSQQALVPVEQRCTAAKQSQLRRGTMAAAQFDRLSFTRLLFRHSVTDRANRCANENMSGPSSQKRALLMVSAFAVAGLILTLICAVAYWFARESVSFSRYPLIPGALLVWSIYGDGFKDAAEFDQLAVPLALAVNTAIGALLGLIAHLATQLFLARRPTSPAR